MKLSKEEIINKINEKVTDEEVKIELMEDISDSLEIEDTSKEDERVKELEEKYNALLEKYKERFLKGSEENDDSEEGRAKKQQLQVQLDEARQNLEETEMDRVLSETDEMLTNLKDEYAEILNERLGNVDKLLYEIITQSNENAENISKTLSDEAAKVGYTISDELSSIWNGNDGASAVLSSYGNNMSNQLTSLNIVLNQIAAKVDAMVSDSDSSAQSNIKNRNSSTANDPGYKKAKKTGAKTIKKGGQVKANKDINMYSFKGDKAGFSQYFANDPIYTVLSVEDGWIQVRHHSLNHGVTGWFNKKDVDNKKVKAYATGGLVNETGLAWLDGTKSKPEMVLNATDTANLRELTGVLRRATKEDFAILEYYDRMADLMKHQSYMIDSLSSVFNQATDGGYHAASNNSTGTMYNEFNMTFELHEVQSGEDVINYLIHSNRFENAIQAMTVDRLVGGSKFAKSKYASKSK